MTSVPDPREALGQIKPWHSIDPDSNRQEVSAADRTKSSSLNFLPPGKMWISVNTLSPQTLSSWSSSPCSLRF